jgi:hypothetical protein
MLRIPNETSSLLVTKYLIRQSYSSEAGLKAQRGDRGVEDPESEHPRNREVFHVSIHIFSSAGIPLKRHDIQRKNYEATFESTRVTSLETETWN